MPYIIGFDQISPYQGKDCRRNLSVTFPNIHLFLLYYIDKCTEDDNDVEYNSVKKFIPLHCDIC